MDRTQELEEEVRRLSQTIEEMRGRVHRLEGGSVASEEKRSRRGFLRMGAAAAAGALGWAAVKAVPAAAATGSYMVLGSGNLAEATTSLTDDSGGGIAGGVFDVQSKNFSSSEFTTAIASTDPFIAPVRVLADSGLTAVAVDGLDVWANGKKAFGVRAFTDTGTAVVGEALSGIGLYARGTGRIQQQPQPNAGTPLIVGPGLYEQVRDVNGILYIHNATGVWRRMNTLRTDAADGSGNPYKPFRIVDTRGGARPAAGTTTSWPIAGQGGGTLSAIPADAIAVTGNLTATGFSSAGYLSIFPGGVANPGTSSLNFSPGQTAIANSFVCGLGNGGQLQVFVGASASHYIIDITGYIQ